jgi:hypothetical protein
MAGGIPGFSNAGLIVKRGLMNLLQGCHKIIIMFHLVIVAKALIIATLQQRIDNYCG